VESIIDDDMQISLSADDLKEIIDGIGDKPDVAPPLMSRRSVSPDRYMPASWSVL